MEERRTQMRRNDDQLHHDERCHFVEAKGYYDNLIREQHKHNESVMTILTKINDMVITKNETLEETFTDIQDQNTLRFRTLEFDLEQSKKRDDIHDKQFHHMFKQIAELSRFTKEQADELKNLRKHLDNGYSDELVDKIKKKSEEVAEKGNDKLLGRMMDMFQTVIEGSTKIKINKQKYFWELLLKITTTGGIVYIIVERLFK